ncbi:G-type lectin S-receptor-like serine/threonine-protein kinase At1g67520 [Helianthus annuus]|uniref:G-type lectin S-receptor-like serine/threonine-protein kinase At1g67520 n=1 Tax=Helianthus annuus TaxID=4232 RepID=UPI001652CB30|nr:G-type lectin S-receptor-like serine/threonine-protein kinase At1g67520 [Helianthus annuus]
MISGSRDSCFPASAVSTIKVGDRLNSTSQLVSPGGNFTLGFFTIPETKYTYLGIWYTVDDSLSRKVWVANPSTPIISNSSVLMINPDTGKLIIDTGGITLVNISDNQSGPTSNLTATLQDIGDFQLKNEVDNQILWKSFDYPTNVLLPGMKLGSDLRTGTRNWKLTSWLSDKVPDYGAFTMSWEPNGENSQRLLIRQRGQPYWTSGDMNDQTFKFMFVNAPWSEYWYNLSYVYNNEERYFSYHGFNGNTPMWILTSNGQVLDDESSALWSPECVAGSNLPQCRSEDDQFFQRNGDFAPDMTEGSSYDDNSSVSFSDCMVRCWNDCSCLGFITNSNGTGCLRWTGAKSVNNFLVNPQGISVAKHGLIAEERQKDDEKHLLELMDSSNTEKGGRKGSHMMVFSFSAIVTATNDFSDENKLGQGGFGPVYKKY